MKVNQFIHHTRTQAIKQLIILSSAAGLTLVTGHSFAGGFQLSDHSVTSLGRAHSGYGIVGDDASAVQFNPAGMSLLTQSQWQLGGAHNAVSAKFTNTASTGANTGDNHDDTINAVVPNAYFVMPLSEKIHFGIGLTSPLGTNTDYDANFVGKYSGLKTKIVTIDINPAIAYQINNSVAIGAGISYQTFDTTLSAAASPLAPGSSLSVTGDSSSFGYNIGTMIRFSEKSRLGLSYRSEIEHDITGDATFSGLGAADGTFAATAEFTSPDTAYIAYQRQISDKFLLAIGSRWTGWSSLDRLVIDFPTALASQQKIEETNWKDAWTYTLGGDYHINTQWTLRAGLALDQTPISYEHNSVRTVDADRTWYSLGGTYHATKKLQLDFAYRYIEFDDSPVNQNITVSGNSIGSLVGNFNNVNIHTLALQLNYKI
ncbi:MAG: outer membrane protein transport protein [Cellvibrionaceae bacterium]|nr:outer membrane protein transport protein [Cellvibrionaceae bacterium]